MKYHLQFYSVLLLFCVVIPLAGCRKKSNLPADFPEVFQLKITVIQNNAPLEGAMVSLKPIGQANKYANGCSAVTDTAGIASIKTFGQDGVPAGKYKIIISKSTDEGGTEVTDEFGGKSIVGAKVYSHVEKKYTVEETAPFEIEVTKGGENSMTCDVGESVHIFLRNAS